MKSKTRQRLKSLFLYLALPASVLNGSLTADELDDLLAPNDEVKLVDDRAVNSWNAVVDAFRKNDFAKAAELGDAFLKADHKTSPYQLLGVRVMMDLANADNPTVTHDVALSVEMKNLMSERDTLRAKYANLQRIAQAADARINKLTNNRKQAVQVGTQAYSECVRAAQEMDQANAAMAAMKPEIEANKLKVGKVEVGANEILKRDTLKLLDMLIEADEIEAAFAITNVFVRVAGSDLDVAKKQQDVIRLRADHEKSQKLVAAISADIEPLVAAGKGEEAQTKLETMMAKVEASDQSDTVKQMTTTKLKALGIKIASAKRGEKRTQIASAAEAAEISARLVELEQKLEKAQEYFGSVIRTIDGFSNYSGDFKDESEKEKAAATLKETVKSGAISKEKVDNLIKAKSEHIGILREVEILLADTSKLTVVQKGRLVNLQTTAQTALDLLKQATP